MLNNLLVDVIPIVCTVLAVIVVIIAIVIAIVCVKKRKQDDADGEQSGLDEDVDSSDEGDKQQDTAPQEQQKEEKPADGDADKAVATKVYHISKRKDDSKWQVKAAGANKAVKLFATQAEAIDYAKTLAENQEARIVIHKEDGSFRRLTYHTRNK